MLSKQSWIFLFFITVFFCACFPFKPNQGTLVAAIGMTLEEVKAQSTLRLHKGFYQNLEWMRESNPRNWIVAIEPGEGLFDWKVGGGNLKFHRCAYYWLQTGEHDDPKIVYMNMGISPKKLTLPEVQAEMQATADKFREADWTEAEKFVWTKGNVTARFYAKEYEVRAYFEKPVEGPNYFQVMEMKLRTKEAP